MLFILNCFPCEIQMKIEAWGNVYVIDELKDDIKKGVREEMMVD